MTAQNPIRNIAIIAHVDHGKTTMVDKMIAHCELFRKDQAVETCLLDSNDQEKERGITILAKNISLNYKGTKINIIDTPGHADFSGEVERVLRLADGCLLLVDAHDGVMPQTKFVLKKALGVGLKVIVVMNKMDRPDARPQEALDMVYDLFLDLSVDDEQLNFPVIYSSAKQGWASTEIGKVGTDISPLMDAIVNQIPAPPLVEGPCQMQITSFEHSDYVGRIGVGRVNRGTIKKGEAVIILNDRKAPRKATIKILYEFDGLGKKEVNEAKCGDICAIVGLDLIEIGDTICSPEKPEALPSIAVDEPTINMLFTVNDSPFYGKEGKYVTSQHIRAFLNKAVEKDVSLRLENTDKESTIKVFGRGVLHLSVMIENMRREGYELAVGQPQVILKMIDGVQSEPFEDLLIEVAEEYGGKVIEEVAKRKGELLSIDYGPGTQIQTYVVPSRGLIGLRSQLLNTCAGTVVMNHRFKEFRKFIGEISKRRNGVLLSLETGPVIPFAIFNLLDRGTFFVNTGEDVYQGQIVGEHCKTGDLDLNVQREKKLTNMRASGSDKAISIPPPVLYTLEQALEYIGEDEWVEVTPKSIRMRKKILDPNGRKRTKREMEVTKS